MLIYYFTRTGRSRQIAEALAEKYHTAARPVTDGKNWSGVLGYIRAGVTAARNKGLPATYEAPAEGEQVAVVFPVWAGKCPPAVKTFAEEVGRGRLIAVPTSLGSQLNDRQGFAKIVDLVGKEITAPGEL